MDKYILDTNIFFNMEEGIGLGEKTEDVVRNITQIKNAEFYMPPRIVDEFLSFFPDKNQAFIKDFLSKIIIQSPDVGRVNLPAQIFYQIIEDMRLRSYKGLRIGEEEINTAGKTMVGQANLEKKDFEIKIGRSIKGFRDRYRQATRYGFLDSLADLDLIMLTKELNGFLVSTDSGVMNWGRVFGIKEKPCAVFGEEMRHFLGSPLRQG